MRKRAEKVTGTGIFLQYLFRMRQEHLPGIRKQHLTAAPLEKLCSELLFKFGYILAHSRLRYGKGRRGPGKTLLPGHLHEYL